MDKNIVLVIQRFVCKHRKEKCNKEYLRDSEYLLFHGEHSLRTSIKGFGNYHYYNYRHVGTTFVWYNRHIFNSKKKDPCGVLPDNY